MPSITIKNIPKDLHEKLKQAAKAHHRSINSELIVCLEQALLPARPDTATVLGNARAIRNRFGETEFNPAQINAAKGEGRK